MNLDIIHVPFAVMREGPSERTKVVSQSYFGEKVVVFEKSGDYALIQTTDDYMGWVKQEAIFRRSTPYLATLETSRLAAHLYATPDTEFGPLLTVPFGSMLQIVGSQCDRWIEVVLPSDIRAFIQRGDVQVEPFDLASFCKKFLGLPYTWGGRTSFGFDCSGFVQMVSKRMGNFLPRDAKDQIKLFKEIPLDKLRLGDLIFWGESEQKIQHVAISLGGSDFIHTSTQENKPYLRVSSLNDQISLYRFRAAFASIA